MLWRKCLSPLNCEEYLITIRVLMSTLGFSFMEEPASQELPGDGQRVRISVEGVNSTGVYTSAGLTVCAGSTAARVVSVAARARVASRQHRMNAAGVLE